MINNNSTNMDIQTDQHDIKINNIDNDTGNNVGGENSRNSITAGTMIGTGTGTNDLTSKLAIGIQIFKPAVNGIKPPGTSHSPISNPSVIVHDSPARLTAAGLVNYYMNRTRVQSPIHMPMPGSWLNGHMPTITHCGSNRFAATFWYTVGINYYPIFWQSMHFKRCLIFYLSNLCVYLSWNRCIKLKICATNNNNNNCNCCTLIKKKPGINNSSGDLALSLNYQFEDTQTKCKTVLSFSIAIF